MSEHFPAAYRGGRTRREALIEARFSHLLGRTRRPCACHVIDYQQRDFTRNGQRYDLILDAKTTRSPFSFLRSLNPGGRYVTVGGHVPRMLQIFCMAPLISRVSGKQVQVVALKPNRGLDYMNDLFESKGLECVIDGTYPLSDVARAVQRFGDRPCWQDRDLGFAGESLELASREPERVASDRNDRDHYVEGRWLAFYSLDKGVFSLAKSRVGASDPPLVLLETTPEGVSPEWSPAAEWIAYVESSRKTEQHASFRAVVRRQDEALGRTDRWNRIVGLETAQGDL